MSESKRNRSQKARRVGTTMTVALALVILALVAVARFHGFRLSTDITYGDLVVGVGTLALAVFTAALAYETFGLDERTALREKDRHDRAVLGVARHLHAELNVMNESLADISKNRHWSIGLTFPRSAWDRSAELILAEVAEPEGEILVEFFAELDSWEAWISRQRAQIPSIEAFALAPGKSLDRLIELHTGATDVANALIDPESPPPAVRAKWYR